MVDCSDAGVVSEPLTAGQSGRRSRIRGRFGVFHQGRLVLEFYDEKENLLAAEVLRENASPLEPIVIDHTTGLPAGAHHLEIILRDSKGARIGSLGRAPTSAATP